jgi:hypothetical protein
LIWVDGQKAPGLEIDDIPLRDVEGIEVYNGPATTPMQFTAGHSMTQCGTIVIWSRPPQYHLYNRKPNSTTRVATHVQKKPPGRLPGGFLWR